MSYLAPERCLKPPHFFRSTRGPRSRYFSGSQVCQTWGGSTTWSSTLMILGSAMEKGYLFPDARVREPGGRSLTSLSTVPDPAGNVRGFPL